jgi:hypothetical protein
LLRLPGPGWTPFLTAIFTAAFFSILTVKFVITAVIRGVLAVVRIGGHRRRDPAATCVSGIAFMVGNGDPDADRRIAPSRLDLLRCLSIDGLIAAMDEDGRRVDTITLPIPR